MADTHCHPQNYEHPEQVVAEHIELGMTLHQMTISPEEYLLVSEMDNYRSNQIHTCLGLYPLEVDLKQQKLEQFLQHLPHTNWIGEVGLDYSVDDEAQKEAQRNAFKTILKHSHELGHKVLSIHSRRAGEDALNFTSSPFSGTIIHHWYSGPTPDFNYCPKHIYFSINTAMLKSRNGKRLLAELPLHKTLLESDGPYIQTKKVPVQPKQLTTIIEALAARHRLSHQEIAEQLHQNYLKATHP
jgi:TatD DNase family protein